jgi:hypothetical protein
MPGTPSARIVVPFRVVADAVVAVDVEEEVLEVEVSGRPGDHVPASGPLQQLVRLAAQQARQRVVVDPDLLDAADRSRLGGVGGLREAELDALPCPRRRPVTESTSTVRP